MKVKDYVNKLTEEEKKIALIELPLDYVLVKNAKENVLNKNAKEIIDFKGRKIIVVEL